MGPWLRSLVLCLALAAGPAAARAAVLFELPPADPFAAGTLFSDLQHPREAASFASLGEDALVTRLTWWGGYFSFGDPPSPTSSPFEIRFFADAGSGPAAAPSFVAAVVAAISPFPAALPQFEFTATLAHPIPLTAGALWWVSIVDVDPDQPTFAWRKTTDLAFSYSRVSSGDGWRATPGIGSLRLEGVVVPEPGTGALAALALAGLGALRRTRAAR